MSDNTRTMKDALEALASISLMEQDNTAPAYVIVKEMGKRARKAAEDLRTAMDKRDDGIGHRWEEEAPLGSGIRRCDLCGTRVEVVDGRVVRVLCLPGRATARMKGGLTP